MRITCDICGKPCRGQGTQGRGRNQRPATSTPTPRPTTPFIPNRHPGLVPVCSAHIHQSARNPRVHHAARPPPDASASSPIRSTQIAKTHRGTYQPNEPNRPSHIHPYPHGHTKLHGPHQRPRPRIRTTHALKTQTTSPKTPHIRSISPKWSALWAHPSPTPPIWRHQQGLRGLPQCPWATEPGQTSETTHRTTRQQPAPPAWRTPKDPDGLATVPVGGGKACKTTNQHRPHISTQTPQVWGAPEGPEGTGGRARRHLEYQRGKAAVPVGGGRAWPDNEPTRRATLAARTASGRAATHGHRHTTQTDPASGRADPHQSPRPHRCGGHRRDRRARAGFEARHRAKRGRLASRAAGPSGARNTRGA